MRNKIRNKHSEKITEIKHGNTNLVFTKQCLFHWQEVPHDFQILEELSVLWLSAAHSAWPMTHVCLASSYAMLFNSILKHSRENFNAKRNCFHWRKIWKEQLHAQEKQLPLSPEIMWQLLLDRANMHHPQGTRTQNCCFQYKTKAQWSTETSAKRKISYPPLFLRI